MRKIAVTTMVMLAALAAAGADWPQFLGPTRNGAAGPAVGKLAESWPEDGPKVLWTVEVGKGFGGAAIRDGEVFFLDRSEKDKRDILRCLSLADGTERWRYSYPAAGKTFGYHGTRSTPAVDDKHVFAIGMYGHVHCISRETHKPVWTKHLLTDYEAKLPNWGVAVSPLLHKGRLILAPLGQAAGVVALEKATGRELWRSPPLGRLAYVSPIVMTVDGADQIVVVPDGGARVAGVDAATGKRLWIYRDWKCNIPIAAPTDCGDGRLFVTGGYKAGSVMLRIRKVDGKYTASQIFKLDDIGSIFHNALVHDGHVYVCANTKRTWDGLMCVTMDGKVLWQTRKDPGFDRGNLLLADGLIYIMEGKVGSLHLVRPTPEKYAELARVKLFGKRPMWGPMAVCGTRLICRDQHEMKCLEVGSGAKPAAAGGP